MISFSVKYFSKHGVLQGIDKLFHEYLDVIPSQVRERINGMSGRFIWVPDRTVANYSEEEILSDIRHKGLNTMSDDKKLQAEQPPCNQSELIEPLGSDIVGRPDMTTIKIAKLKMLAEAVLVAHKGQGYYKKDCPHVVEYGDGYQRCHGGEYDCCKCAACNDARLILGA